MDDHGEKLLCQVGDAQCKPPCGAEGVAPSPLLLNEGDQPLPEKKPSQLFEPDFLVSQKCDDPEQCYKERAPSRLVEDRGDDEATSWAVGTPTPLPLTLSKPVIEEDGEKPRLPLSARATGTELGLDPAVLKLLGSEAHLDEGYMVSELLKKGRLKNSTFTEKGLVLEAAKACELSPADVEPDTHVKKQISVLLEATQNITLRYQVVGTVGSPFAKLEPNFKTTSDTEALSPACIKVKTNVSLPPVMPPNRDTRQEFQASTDRLGKTPRPLSSSDEMLYFKEKVRSAPGTTLERKGASCSKLQLASTNTNSRPQPGEKASGAIQKKGSRSALPPAYSPSQLNFNKVKSQIAEMTLRKPSRVSQVSPAPKAGEEDDKVAPNSGDVQCMRKLSKITQLVISSSKQSPLRNEQVEGGHFTQKKCSVSVQKLNQMLEANAEHGQEQKKRFLERGGPVGATITSIEQHQIPNSVVAFRTFHESASQGRDSQKGRRELAEQEIKDRPVLEVIEKSDQLVSPTPGEKAKRRVRRYYRREEDFYIASSSSSNDSMVKLDSSTVPTETSELMAERALGAEGTSNIDENVNESITSWYSFESDPLGSQRSDATCDAKPSDHSWRSYRNSNTHMNMGHVNNAHADRNAAHSFVSPERIVEEDAGIIEDDSGAVGGERAESVGSFGSFPDSGNASAMSESLVNSEISDCDERQRGATGVTSAPEGAEAVPTPNDQQKEKAKFKASNLIRYFESIH